MVLDGIDTQELLQQAKADASSFIVVAAVLVASLFLAWIASRSIDAYLEHHLSDALWIQENRRQIKLFIRSIGALFIATIILSLTNVFSELSWVLAPILIVSLYFSRKTLQNMTEHFALVLEGKIQLTNYIHISNKGILLDASGRIVDRNSRKSSFSTVDGGEIILRNHDIFESTIKNYAHSTLRRLTLSMRFPITHSFQEIDELIIGVIRAHEHVLHQYPIDPLLEKIEDAHYIYTIHCWVSKEETSLIRIRQELKHEILKAVSARALKLPYQLKEVSYSLS